MTQSLFPAAAPVAPATSAAPAPAINPFFPNGAPAPTFSTPVGGGSQQNQKPKVFPSGPAMKGNTQKKGHVDFHKVGSEPRKTGIQKGKPTRGGVGKDYDSKTNQRATQRKGINAANLQRTLNAGSDATVNMQTFTNVRQRAVVRNSHTAQTLLVNSHILLETASSIQNVPTHQEPVTICTHLRIRS